MSIQHIKVLTIDLKPGMFVSSLDRPWLETKYKVQGFLIKNQQDVDRLTQCCEYVFIDTAKSIGRFDIKPAHVASSSDAPAVLTDEQQKLVLIKVDPIRYENSTSFEDELNSARQDHHSLRLRVKSLVSTAMREQHLDLKTLQKVIAPMVDSVIRNPDAYTWLAMMKDRDDYTYNHLVSCSIWAAALGRSLGLPIKDIKALSLGALLFDIGKLRLPEKLIKKAAAYNKYEFALIQGHVKFGIELMQAATGITDNILEMATNHHERHDGSGYPHGKEGMSIPLFARIAGIVDSYDAMISERYHTNAISPHEAVKKLYEISGTSFQAELVEQFIQVVGIYPVGTLIELSDGRVGVVVSHQRTRRLRPNLMLILDENKTFYSHYKLINLANETEGVNGRALNIQRTVDANEFDIDPNDFYL